MLGLDPAAEVGRLGCCLVVVIFSASVELGYGMDKYPTAATSVTDFSIFSLRQTIGSLVQIIREFRTLLLTTLFGRFKA